MKTKNRYKDIVPCKAPACYMHVVHENANLRCDFNVVDRSRVILKTLEDSTDEYVNTAAGADYINASFLDVSD